MDNLHELLLQIQHLAQGDPNPETVCEIQLFIASYSPPRWQCNAKLRDAHKPWAVAIDEEPETALMQALYLAQRGDKARQAGSRGRFYPDRGGAQAHGELLEMEYEDHIRQITVEFEPYKGWVVVVFPKETSFGFFKDLDIHAEVREEVSQPTEIPAPRSRREPTTSRVRTPGTTTPQGGPKEGRAALTKDKLEAEYKEIFGKFPDRNIKKADLAKLLDEHQASTSEPSDEDLL